MDNVPVCEEDSASRGPVHTGCRSRFTSKFAWKSFDVACWYMNTNLQLFHCLHIMPFCMKIRFPCERGAIHTAECVTCFSSKSAHKNRVLLFAVWKFPFTTMEFIICVVTSFARCFASCVNGAVFRILCERGLLPLSAARRRTRRWTIWHR